MFSDKEFLACCGSTKFAEEMVLTSPFTSLDKAVAAARNIWFNKIDVIGWLEAFSAHPQIGQFPSSAHTTAAQFSPDSWSAGEQSTALATATASSLEELSHWNAQYRRKFGFVFLICASGRSTDEILAELKKRYLNRPIDEFKIAAEEQMKIIEIRLGKLFSTRKGTASAGNQHPAAFPTEVEEDHVGIIGGHQTAPLNSSGKTSQIPTRTRPPITTHVLDVSRGCPAAGVDVRLEMWKGTQPHPLFGETDGDGWVVQGSSTTDADGRSGQLISIVNDVNPGIYKISFDTRKYCPSGFFPFVSIVFEIRESQHREHFHVPLLLSPFSFTSYRGS